MTPRTLLRELTPPLLVSAARRLKSGRSDVEWEYFPGGFAAAPETKVRGWNDESVCDVYRHNFERTRDCIARGVPFGLSKASDATSDNAIVQHNVAMSFALALDFAARGQSSLSMLDWGGALGHYLLTAKALRPDLTFDYTCKEMPLFLEAGRALQDDVCFDDGSECLKRRYDLAMAICSLHYSEDWRAELQRLAGVAGRALFVSRLPLCLQGASYTFIQRPYAHGYRTEYVGWCLNRDEFLGAANGLGLKLTREFLGGERPPIQGAPAPCEYRAFLFAPSS